MNSSYATSTTSTPAGLGVVVYMALIFLFLLPSLIITWRLYKKAGKPGWATLVPLYGNIVQLQIAKLPVWYILLLLVPGVNFVIDIVIIVNFAKQYNRKLGFWLAYLFLPIVAVFLVGKTEYTGGETVAATATPASPADTAALAPAPVEATPEPASEPVAPVASVAPVEPVAQTPVAPVESTEASPVVAPTFGMPTVETAAEAPVLAPTEPSTAPVNPWEQPSTAVSQTPAVEPTAEEPVLQGFNMPADPVVSPESAQQPAQEEPDTTQQPPVTPLQQPLQ